MRRLHSLLLAPPLALALSVGQCQPVLPATLQGAWGGEHVAMTVTDAGAELEYDCARGRIQEPLELDAAGRFVALGVHVRGHPGPEREGETPDEHPARYTGRVRGATMTFSVQLTDTGEEIGSFVLERGVAARVYRCL